MHIIALLFSTGMGLYWIYLAAYGLQGAWGNANVPLAFAFIGIAMAATTRRAQKGPTTVGEAVPDILVASMYGVMLLGVGSYALVMSPDVFPWWLWLTIIGVGVLLLRFALKVVRQVRLSQDQSRHEITIETKGGARYRRNV